MMLSTLAKVLIFGGALMLIIGAILLVAARFFPSGLPGDISFRRGNTSVYIPIVSSIVFSIVATIVLNIIVRFFNR
jgi:Zn-dependent protease with chaperone function